MKKSYCLTSSIFLIILVLIYFSYSLADNKKCSAIELNVLTINSFNLNPDIPRISYIGSSFADMTITRLSAIKGVHLIERTQLERGKKKLGIKENELITRETAVKIGKLLNADLVVLGTIQTQSKESFKVGSQILDLRKEAGEDKIFTSDPVLLDGGVEGIEKSTDIEQINRLQGRIAQFITDAIPVMLNKDEVSIVNKDYTRTGPAYVCYARGRDFYVKYTAEDNDKAIEFFKKAVEIDPNYALAYAGLADSYAQKGGFFECKDKDYLEEGIKAGKKAIELDPNLPEGYKSLGTVYCYKGWLKDDDEELNKGIEKLNKALEFNYYYIDAHLNIGKIYMKKGDLSRAEEEFKNALSMDPFYSHSHYYMAHFYKIQKNYSDSLKEFERVIELETELKSPKSRFVLDSHIERALCYIGMDNLKSAKDELKKAGEINSDDSYIHYANGILYTKEEKYDDAIKELETYLKMQPDALNKRMVEELLEEIKKEKEKK